MKKNKQKKAFVSMFAIFFSAIIVSILTGMFALLIKQIEILNIDTSSFQAYYVADSTFECLAKKEKIATGTKSFFLPGNSAGLGDCSLANDLSITEVSDPLKTNATQITSIIKYDVITDTGFFCGTAEVTKQINTEKNNTMFIVGQDRDCGDDSLEKVIERGIDFFY